MTGLVTCVNISANITLRERINTRMYMNVSVCIGMADETRVRCRYLEACELGIIK